MKILWFVSQSIHYRGFRVFRQLNQSRRCSKALPTSETHFESTESPLLYIKKYKTLIDTEAITPPTILGNESSVDRHQKKISFTLSSLEKSKNLSNWTKELKPYTANKTFAPSTPISSKDTNTIFSDEEKISDYYSSSSSSFLLKRNERDVERNPIVGFIVKDPLSLSELPRLYASLSKAKLTLLVSVTCASGYALAPVPFDLLSCILSTVGTACVACSANSINQIMEVPFDSQMTRTKNRVLVQRSLSSVHALIFSLVSGVTGTLLLSTCVNGISASLGLLTLLLYTVVYTPLKRLSILNTWVGSVVGSIPPLIGWTSATGSLDSGAFVLGSILYAWQFPHFNALSWNLRHEYAKAGYRMCSVSHPNLCKRVALTYSLSLIGICTAAPLLNVTNITFLFDSLPLNLYLSYLAAKFYRNPDSSSSRKLFRFSLIHLPLLMTLLFIGNRSIQ